MKCPIDGSELQMTERQGIEIDYCPQCRGIWLDRGELDKIIERSAAQAPVSSKRGDDHRLEGSYPYDDEDAKHKKRRSLLGDLFDF